MADPDQIPHTAPVTDIAEPHQSAVTAILRAALQGVFSMDEADLLIERIRTRATTSDQSIKDSLGSRTDGADPESLNSPDRTPP